MSVFSNPASTSLADAKSYTEAIVGLVGSRDPMTILRDTPAAIRQGIAGLSDAQLTQPEAPGKWSIGQMIQHLADSELVWGYRLRMVLAHERPPLIGYDQDLWADRLRYADTDVPAAIETWSVLRRADLRLLDGASEADFARVGVHAERGEESIAHMVRMFAGHDLMHVRQLERIRRAVTAK
jgi:uncharacterized damage-inducible protein DinB